ncbi:ribonucleoside-diphosphate reductase subunit alpha [Candidatus Wolfebacteria bacterium]|nr:ribonucleoside-diphosphate reductase subunit alpha [Candidatus Wolfebacteria bacterium]
MDKLPTKTVVGTPPSSTEGPRINAQDAVLSNIEKRDGRVVPFNKKRIEEAIEKACTAVSVDDTSFIPGLVDELLLTLERDAHANGVTLLTVEQVQDGVEEVLMRNKQFNIAKHYILYRDERTQARKNKHYDLLAQLEEKKLVVTKASGEQQTFDLHKIKRVFNRACRGYENKCHFEDFLETFKRNLANDIETKNINKFMIKTAIDMVTIENSWWQHIAARILLENVYKQATKNRGIGIKDLYTGDSYLALFEEYVQSDLYYKDFFKYYTKEDIKKAGKYMKQEYDDSYQYTTVLSLTKRYLLNPNGVVKETPQELYMSVALFLAIPEASENRLKYAFKLYDACANQMISLPTPTLLNSRTNYHQLSSCFKINVDDDLRAIYHAIENVAQISKFGGGVGMYWGNIRSRESSIRGVKKASGGVNPWIKVINDTGVAVNQLGARMGAISVTLDMWHRDIYDFLDLQTETGDIRSKSFDIFPAISVPDIFMRRVRENEQWSLFDPHEVEKVHGKRLQDLFGKEFEEFYEELERDDRLTLRKEVSAKDLFKKHLKTVVETGMPYIFFRDTVNRLNPNKHAGNVYSTQLCTEICQNTSPTKFEEESHVDGTITLKYKAGDTVVCNLASINIAKVHSEKTIAQIYPVLMRALDNVITLNYYPIKEAERTAKRYRSVGVGYLGLAEYLATNHVAYDSEEAKKEVNTLFERYSYHMYRASADLAKERGHYELYPGSEYSKGILLGREKQWYLENTGRVDAWETLFADMITTGFRFGYHTGPAPNTSTAGVVGTTAALLPIYKRFFVENNLSSPTIRVAPQLDKDNFPYYKEYVALDMKDVIDLIAEVYQWIDQSISFEWMINPEKTSPQQLYEYYLYAWEKGIKTVYYVRSLSAKVDNINEDEKSIETVVAPEKPEYNVCDSCSG